MYVASAYLEEICENIQKSSVCHALHALLTQFACKLELSGANWSGQIQVLPSEQAAGIKLGSKVTFSSPQTLGWTHSATVCML